MAISVTPPPKPWVETPIVRSSSLSRIAGCNIYLKLETVQPSGSFKSRGIGNLLLSSLSAAEPIRHFYCSSGGNAGLACATAAKALGKQATIVVPMSTQAMMVEKLRALDVDVVQTGKHLGEADTYLREQLLSHDPHGVYVPPFDHPAIWAGNSTIIDELETQMAESTYDAVICSVGGGGLLIGIMEGLAAHGRLAHTKVVAVETQGAESLSLSLRNGALSRLSAITSIATSLGATQVAQRAYECAQRREVHSVVVSDAQAAMACVRFAEEERILVEPACGASVAVALDATLLRDTFAELDDAQFAQLNIVVIVCGGSGVTLSLLAEWSQRYGAATPAVAPIHDDVYKVKSPPRSEVSIMQGNREGKTEWQRMKCPEIERIAHSEVEPFSRLGRIQHA